MMTELDTDPDMTALVVGATGIAGLALCEELTRQSRMTYGISRRAASTTPGVRPVLCDLEDAGAVRSALAEIRPTHVFIVAWKRMPTEAENIDVNGRMVRNVLAGIADPSALRHVALMTGLKHYVGSFEAFGTGVVRDTPFHESEPRLDAPNFYYAQEDELWSAAGTHGFTWSVHRAHTVIGFAVGNAMNMGQTLAVQAAISKKRGIPFTFPGNELLWNGVNDMTDAGLLARHMIWAATTPEAADTAFNIANGDVFRWRWMWPRLAELLGVEPEGYSVRARPLAEQMDSPESARDWAEIVALHGLREPNIERVASWWHTDLDMNTPVENFTDMARSRRAGFLEQVVTEDAFAVLFDRLRTERVIPPR